MIFRDCDALARYSTPLITGLGSTFILTATEAGSNSLILLFND